MNHKKLFLYELNTAQLALTRANRLLVNTTGKVDPELFDCTMIVNAAYNNYQRVEFCPAPSLSFYEADH